MQLKNDLLYFRRELAQSKVVMATEISKSGNKRVKSSINAEKIADTTRQLLQGNNEYSEYKYDVLYKKASEELAEDFTRLGLDESKNLAEKKLFQKKKRIAISNWIEQYIKDTFPNILKIDFDTFVKATNIKTANRSVSQALTVLEKAQNSNFYEIEHMKLDLKTGELMTGISRINALPTITLWLDESMSNKGYTLSSFAKCKIRNKRSHIKGLEIEFSAMYLYHVLSIGNDYVTSRRSRRDTLTHISSHKFDILLESVYKMQRNPEALTFTLEEIKDRLGVRQEIEYKYLKKDTLLPSIKDLKENMGKIITMKEIKVGKQVEAITFSIKMEEKSDFEEFLYKYISSQLFYFTKVEIKDINKFSNYLKGKHIDDNENIGEKTFVEWKKEAELSFESEKKILLMIEEDEMFFKSNELIYDKIKHTLLKEKIQYEDGEEKKVYIFIKKTTGEIIRTPIESEKYLLKLEMEYMNKSIHLIDLIPFLYSDTLTGRWIKIDSIDVLNEYREKIIKDIVLKNTDKFSFKEEIQKSMFCFYVEKNKFNEITKMMKKRIQQVFDI